MSRRIFYSQLIIATILLLSTSFYSNAAPLDSLIQPVKRATIVSPTGWKLSWTVSGKRASTGASNGGLGYTFIAKSGGVTQALVNQCVTTCTKTSKCGDVQVFQVSGSTSGTVVCALYNQYIASTKATYTTGPTGGTIVTSYGLRNLNTPVSGSGTTTTVPVATSTITKPASTKTQSATTSTITKATTTSTVTKPASTTILSATVTTSTAVATVSFPASPPGATLVQFAPCSSVSKATVPLFVNNQYAGSTQTSAYIVQHGSGQNFQDYFTAVYNVIGTNGIIAAPNFYYSNSPVAPNTWFQPSVNLGWQNTNYSWSSGTDAVSPNSVACSSMDIFDSLLAYFNNKSKFPNLTKVYFVSHSGGANLVSRYSQVFNGNYPFAIRFIVANAANQAYFDNSRPEANVASCSNGFLYQFQLVSSGMPRYVASRFTSAAAIFQNWISRDVVTLIGSYDTVARYPGGVEDCGSQAQGGVNRRDRNYAWWAYTNILAGTGADVAAYTGYQQLIASGAKTLYKGTFNHQNCVVDQVGHNQNAMFSSVCGVAAMTTSQIPAGAGPTLDGGS